MSTFFLRYVTSAYLSLKKIINSKNVSIESNTIKNNRKKSQTLVFTFLFAKMFNSKILINFFSLLINYLMF